MSVGGLSRLLGREATALGWMTAGRSAFESRDMHGYGTPAVPRPSLTPGTSRTSRRSGANAVSWLVQAGAIELALGALSGWGVAAAIDKPHWLKRIGVRAAPRLRQAHLDWILMGLILVGIGLAAPDLPLAIALPLVFGAWVNATLFVPLAFAPDADQHRAYRMVTLVSFTAMSFGATAAAIHLLVS